MKVRAKKLGYYGDKRRREGAVFHLKDKSEFSKLWMVELGEEKEASEKPSSKAKPAIKEAKKVDLEVI